MSEVQAPVTTEREVTIYATRGGQIQKITTAAKTWGELQPLVRNAGFDLSSLHAAENINKSDLVNELAVLPTGPFRLFLRPKQTKSGAPDRKECFGIIKAHLTVYPEDKSKFIIEGKNMTQLSTPVVQDLVARFCSGTAVKAAAVTTVTAKKEVAKKAETIKKTEVPAPITQEVAQLPVKDKCGTPIPSQTTLVLDALDLILPLSSFNRYEKAKRALKKLHDEIAKSEGQKDLLVQETEEEVLAREAKEFMQGYK
jgi:hypothetical protein